MEKRVLRLTIIWLTALSCADIIMCLITVNTVKVGPTAENRAPQYMLYPYVNAFARPVIITLQTRSIRNFWRRYLLVIKGSLPMTLFVFVYVFYFAWMGNRLFSGTIEGVQSFANLDDSFFYMFVLLTTSNYPDVMLPSYA